MEEVSAHCRQHIKEKKHSRRKNRDLINTNSYFDIVLETIYKLIPSTFPIKFSHINKEELLLPGKP